MYRSPVIRSLRLLALGGVVLVSGCGSTVHLPDRSSPEVAAEEARLAELLGKPGAIFPHEGTCAVRLLGRNGTSSYAWVECTEVGGDHPGWGTSMPVRVDVDRVVVPQEDDFGPSVGRMFPRKLADYVLNHQAAVRP
jgi:hypothetical protein